MSIWQRWNRLTLWDRLSSVLDVEPGAQPVPPIIPPWLTPTYDTRYLLGDPITGRGIVNISVGSGTPVKAFGPELGWRFVNIFCRFAGSSGNTTIYVKPRSSTDQDFRVRSPSASSEFSMYLDGITLEHRPGEDGGEIGLIGTGNAGDGARVLDIFYMREPM